MSYCRNSCLHCRIIAGHLSTAPKTYADEKRLSLKGLNGYCFDCVRFGYIAQLGLLAFTKVGSKLFIRKVWSQYPCDGGRSCGLERRTSCYLKRDDNARTGRTHLITYCCSVTVQPCPLANTIIKFSSLYVFHFHTRFQLLKKSRPIVI